MKKRLLILFFVLAGVFGAKVHAQVDDQKCQEQLSIYYEYYKAKNYKDAFGPWKFVFENCPDSHKNVYIHGPNIIKKVMAKAPEAEQAALKEMLIKCYDQRLEHFPGSEGSVLGRKAADMLRYKVGTTQEAMDVLNQAIDISGAAADPAVINAYFNGAVRMYQEKNYSLSQVFEVYDNAMELLEENRKLNQAELNKLTADSTVVLDSKQKKLASKLEKRIDVNQTVANNFDKKMEPIATCERLNKIYSEQFEENKTDENWLKRAVTMLGRKKCFDGDLYLKVAEAYYQVNPTAKAARAIAIMSSRNKDNQKALQYFKEAAEKSSNDIDAADNMLNAANASFKLGRKSEARSLARESLSKNPKLGEAYMLIGHLYADSANDCGANIFEKKAVYWAAIKEYKRARSVDASVSADANKFINAYAKQVPNKEMIFQYGMSGKDLKIGCWINTTVKVPAI